MDEKDELKTAEQGLQAQLRRDVLATLGTADASGVPPAGAVQVQMAHGLAATNGLKAWSDYIDLLKPAGELIDLTWEPQGQQMRADLYRLLVMNIAQGYIWLFQSTPEHPDWMPFENSIFLLQPNPDGIYHVAPVSGDGVYRIVGHRGSNPVMGFALGHTMFGMDDPRPGLNNYDADGLTIARDGSFEVIFSTTKPDGWSGDWRYLHPETGCILIRQFSCDWGKEQEARFAIERLDRPALKPRLTAEDVSRRLDALLGGFVRRFAKLCIQYQNGVMQKIGLNSMELSGFEDLGNSAEWPQKYWRCIYDYQPGEALIVETELPEKCKYWNVQLNDGLWNQIEFAYRQSSLNAHQARLDSDGRFRAVIALEDPGVPNWLDSGAHRRGMLVGRWYGADSHPMPTIRKVPFSDIRQHLPADTPRVTAEERDLALRARNIGVQMRRRW
jgi:hypothetical protein